MTPKLLKTNNSQLFFDKKLVYKRFTNGGFDSKTKRDFINLDRAFNKEPLIIKIINIRESPFKTVVGISSDEKILVERRLPEECKLSNVAINKKLTKEHIDSLAHELFLFHASSKRYKKTGRYCVTLFTRDIKLITQNAPSSSYIFKISKRFQIKICATTPLFLKRSRGGMIRALHGDLSLDNIFIVDGKMVYSDFGHRIKYRVDDVTKDVASLFLDLVINKNEKFANRFLKEYINVSGDHELELLLPMYVIRILLSKAGVYGGYFDKIYKNKKQFEKIQSYIEKFSKNI